MNHSRTALVDDPLRTGAACLAGVAAIGALDWATGVELSIALLYLFPVVLAAWYGGRTVGLLIAVASAGAALAADWWGRQPVGAVGEPQVLAWNALMLAGMFIVVALALAALKRSQSGLEATVALRTATLEHEVQLRRQGEAQLRQAHAALQSTQLQLIEAAKMEAVGRMAAGVAHEVKNPLTTLGLGADYFLRRQPLRDEEAALLHDMKQAVGRASSIINEMLDFARPRPLRLAPEDLNTVVEASLRLVRHILAARSIVVEQRLQPGLPAIALDALRMEQVIVNLVTNAAQAMAPGGTLTVTTSSDLVPAAQVTLDIEDTGPGIATEHLAKVFDPFFTTKQPGEGTGLGLAIVRSIVRIHGASIVLDNLPRGGARARIVFTPEPKES